MKKILPLLLIFLALEAWAKVDKPNIIFILADDMSYDSVSAFNDQIGNMKTPNIDKLVSQGMSFTDAHSGSAVCTPTRYGLLTGRYCWRTKLKREVLWEYGSPLITADRLTVAKLLKSQGYHTAAIGKWHLGMNWHDKKGKIANYDLKIHDSFFKGKEAKARIDRVEKRIDFTQRITGGPTDCGFDYFFGVDAPNFPPYVWQVNDKLLGNPSMAKPKKTFGHPGPMLPGWKLDEIIPTLVEKTEEYIEQRAKSGKPFFLYLPLTSPHTPIAPGKAFIGKTGISDYADFVVQTDDVVGRVMKALKKQGLAKNTILIFSSDNGTSGFANFKLLRSKGVNLHNHFSGHKASISEGGHRVPFVVRWPSGIKAGSRCKQVVSLNDFIATVADLLDYQLPPNAGEDSTSILPLFKGEKKRLPNRPMVVNHDYGGRFAIRDNQWKLIDLGRKPRLYNLDSDLKEKTNLASKFPDRVKKMREILNYYKQSGRSRKRKN